MPSIGAADRSSDVVPLGSNMPSVQSWPYTWVIVALSPRGLLRQSAFSEFLVASLVCKPLISPRRMTMLCAPCIPIPTGMSPGDVLMPDPVMRKSWTSQFDDPLRMKNRACGR